MLLPLSDSQNLAMTRFTSWFPSGAYITGLDPDVGGNNQTVCFSFWYLMYGFDVGTLEVHFDGEWQYEQPLWSRVGNHGERWLHGELLIPANITKELKQVT